MSIEIAFRSDKGLVRPSNEDTVMVQLDPGIVVLTDGMGGYKAGEVASKIAAESIVEYLCDGGVVGPNSLEGAVEAANEAILDAIDQNSGYEGMATTVVAGSFDSHRLHYAHVGDSRLYRFRGEALVQLTRDHSMIQELVNQNHFANVEEALAAGVKNNVLTRGLGITDHVVVDTAETGLDVGDIYLLCSDGLSNMVDMPVLEEVLSNREMTLEEKADCMIKHALESGGADNVSLILISVLSV
ncbi:MAG: serine/threonine-protein phosphatase [Gammaproteobacteria bacterium]|nr:serine/threonine-protein phosphatase [Gammaproteobacteria bacterium]